TRMINDQPPIPPRRQLCDERCAGGLAVTACYTTKWDVIAIHRWAILAQPCLPNSFPKLVIVNPRLFCLVTSAFLLHF
ncbi:hypothetical protein, partial [Aquidulcibacter sp.]|uniref:hypothetical protein n=1 Tax=Aquidulcibacter sp. TaxID=2052990 RepID=UPI0037C17B29